MILETLPPLPSPLQSRAPTLSAMLQVGQVGANGALRARASWATTTISSIPTWHLNGPSGDGSPADAAVLNISGLGSEYTSGGYTVIIYSDSDRRGGGTAARQSIFTITPAGGSPVSAFVEDDNGSVLPNTFSGSYVFGDGVEDGADYSNFTIIEGLSASSFTLEVTSPGGGGRGAISGFPNRGWHWHHQQK